MASIMNTTNMDGEWTTVKSKAYVPPHLKKETNAAQTQKSLNFDDTAAFPSLGGPAKSPSLWINAKNNSANHTNLSLDSTADDFPSLGCSSVVSTPMKMSFTQKIKDLIQLEQQNESDRAAAEEKKRELDGFVSLSLKFTPERYMSWSDKINAGLRIEKTYEDLTEFLNGYIQTLPYPPSFPISDLDETYTVISEISSDPYEIVDVDSDSY
jgi:hypothetical protein